MAVYLHKKNGYPHTRVPVIASLIVNKPSYVSRWNSDKSTSTHSEA